MIVKSYEKEKAFRIMNTQSRRADLSPKELSEIHKKIGEMLSYKIVESFDLESVDIQHVQGIRTGESLSKDEKVLILVMMRSGLYLADGLKNIFNPNYYMEFVYGDFEHILEKYDGSYSLIVADSVINTGKTMKNILEASLKHNFKRKIGVALVMHNGALEIFSDIEDLEIHVARISTNFYVGKGKTDTGNRLFGRTW